MGGLEQLKREIRLLAVEKKEFNYKYSIG